MLDFEAFPVKPPAKATRPSDRRAVTAGICSGLFYFAGNKTHAGLGYKNGISIHDLNVLGKVTFLY